MKGFTQNIATILRNKSVRYFIILALILVSIETSVRLNEDSFSALQEKALIKLQMFMLRDQTDIVFIGSSRTQDGIEPDVITESLAKLSPELSNVSVFNAASSKASLDRLAYFADRALDKPGLKILALEVSGPQLKDKSWSPSFYSESPAKDTEDYLQKMLSKHSYTIRYRKSFRIDNILRSPLLFMSNASDGTEVFRRGNAKQWFAESYIELTDLDKDHWKSKLITSANSLESNKAHSSVKSLNIYQSIAKKAQVAGVKLLLFVPPVTGDDLERECNDEHLSTYKSLATATQAPLILHSCIPLRKEFFYKNDVGHLNKKGRTVWSRNLAIDILQHLLTNKEI